MLPSSLELKLLELLELLQLSNKKTGKPIKNGQKI